MTNYINKISALLGAFIGFLYGGEKTALLVLITLMSFDFVSGIISAYVNQKLDSRECYRGIAKKISILILVSVGHLIDMVVDVNWIESMVIYFYIANEALSLIENAALIGIPIPKKFIKALEQLKSVGDEDEVEV